MTTKKLTKLLALYLPYILLGLVATNLGEVWRLAEGKELGDKIMAMMGTFPVAFAKPLPSLHPLDLLIGFSCGAGLRLAVYLRSKNAKKYRHGMEYGSARWGNAKDIEPFMSPKFADNIILTKTERLMMSNCPPDPKNARNKNVLVVGGSGSGKTRFWLKPNLLQCHSSYVVTDPKGTIVLECGQAMLKNGYKVKILNTINFKKSMHDFRNYITHKGYPLVSQTFSEKDHRLINDAFIIATHTDREHIHNHIIYNSTALDSTRKFRDFLLSGLAVQRLSDLICLEHQLSVIEIKPYRERQKRTLYPPRESNRDKLCAVIDNILLSEKPASFEGFLQKLEQRGYEIKRGKYTSVKGTRQKCFIRFRTLGAGYSEDEIKAVIAGDAEHCPHQKQPPKEKPFNLLVDVQAKLAEGKNIGYARWAKKYNLKEMSKTLIFLQEKKIGSIEEMQERVDAATARYHELGDSIKAAETRMTEIAVLRTHIVNYTKTRPVYDAYRKAGYSKRFLENHRAEITLHKAAKMAFDEAKLKKLPKVKELDAEYSKLLTEKKAAYPDYRKAKDEMQELLRAQRNVELFFAEEKNTTEKTQSR